MVNLAIEKKDMNSKFRIMLDCNAFDKFLEFFERDEKHFNELLNKVNLYVNNMQLKEIEKIKNSKNRREQYEKIINMMKCYDMKRNRGGYFGFYGSGALPFDHGCFQSEESRNYQSTIEKCLDKTKSPNRKRNNKADAYLATVAKDYGCTVITEDGAHKKDGLYSVLKYNGSSVLTFDELLQKIGILNS